jgi:hypothetical protein
MGWSSSASKAIGLFLLMLMVHAPLTQAQVSEQGSLNEGRMVYLLADGETLTLERPMVQDTFTLVAWDCVQCTVRATGNGVSITHQDSTQMVLEATLNTTLTLEIEASTEQSVHILAVVDVNDDHPTVRPAPSATAPSMEIAQCTNVAVCVNATRDTLASHLSTLTSGEPLQSGLVNSEEAEYAAIEVSAGDTIEWQWLFTSTEVSVQLYHQTSEDELIIEQIHSTAGAYAEVKEGPPSVAWWEAPADGRFIAKISTEMAHAAWAANIISHPATPTNALVDANLTEGVHIVGHGQTMVPFEWNDVHQLQATAHLAPVSLRIDQFFSGSWVLGNPTTVNASSTLSTYPYPDTTAGRILVMDAPVFALEIGMDTFADLSGLEAPSVRPSTMDSNNTTWPVLNLTTTEQAAFTLAIHDTVDTYRLEVEGWEDSIHFLQFTIEGEIAGLEVQIWDIDQTSGDVLNTDITQPIGDELKIGLQVGRGTHFLQLRFQNASSVTSHLWGEHVEDRTYSITSTYSLIDEGEEPWFPPSEDAVYWGNFARWFLGILFLLPVLYLGVHIKRSNTYAAEIASKQQRLAWYSSRLDSGESTVKRTRMDMARALHAVAQLEWQDGMDAWGETRLEHRTDNLALAVWRVDQRLAQTDDGWPLVIGLHVLEGVWDLAALRFDAPDGAAYEVVHVEPRFLHQGEEIFLDTMGPGHRVFLMVELRGDAPSVDIELNGRVNNEPFAARIPETLVKNE